jgi:hypothetical protein
VDISLYTFLSLAVNGGDWSAAHPSLYAWESNDDLLIVYYEPTTQAIPASFTIYRDVTTHPGRLQLLICLYIIACYMGNSWGISVYHWLALLILSVWISKLTGNTKCEIASIKVITFVWNALISVLSESHSIWCITQLWHVDMTNSEDLSVLFALFWTVVPSYSGLSSPRRWMQYSPSKCQEVLIQWHRHVPKVWKLWHHWFENIKLAWLTLSPGKLLLLVRGN